MWLSFTEEEARLIESLAMLAMHVPEIKAIKAKITTRLSEEKDPVVEEYRKAAVANHQKDGEFEFDSDAVVSQGDDAGAYVMGWCWVDSIETGIEVDENEEIRK